MSPEIVAICEQYGATILVPPPRCPTCGTLHNDPNAMYPRYHADGSRTWVCCRCILGSFQLPLFQEV